MSPVNYSDQFQKMLKKVKRQHRKLDHLWLTLRVPSPMSNNNLAPSDHGSISSSRSFILTDKIGHTDKINVANVMLSSCIVAHTHQIHKIEAFCLVSVTLSSFYLA